MSTTIPTEILESEEFFELGSSVEKQTANTGRKAKLKNPDEEYLNIVTAQTELNGKILTVIQKDKLDDNLKSHLLALLSNNAHSSSYIQTAIRDKQQMDLLEDVPLNNLVQPATETTPTDSFKTMIMSFYNNITPILGFRDNLNKHWLESFEITRINFNEKSLPFVNNFVKYIQDNYDKFNVFAKRIDRNLYLFGQKNKLKKLQKKYHKIFDLLKVDSNEFLTEKVNLDENSIHNNIVSHLQKKLGIEFNSETKTYQFSMLNDLPSELRFDALKQLFTKEVQDNIANLTKINSKLEEDKNENKYMKMVLDFSNSHNLNPDIVIHYLKTNPAILEDYNGFNKLNKNKDSIIEANEHFSTIVQKNVLYINELIQLQKQIFSEVSKLEIDDNTKKQFIETIENGKIQLSRTKQISYSDISNNIERIISDQNKHKKNSSSMSA